jgi:hypothetical protein
MWVGIQCSSSILPEVNNGKTFLKFILQAESIILLQVPFNRINLTQIKIFDIVPRPSHQLPKFFNSNRIFPDPNFVYIRLHPQAYFNSLWKNVIADILLYIWGFFYSVDLISYLNFNHVTPSHLISNVSAYIL